MYYKLTKIVPLSKMRFQMQICDKMEPVAFTITELRNVTIVTSRYIQGVFRYCN